MLKKFLLLFIFYVSLISCHTVSGPVLTAPVAPDAPAIKSAGKLDEADKRALAEFYKEYRIFLMKYNEWKKEWK